MGDEIKGSGTTDGKATETGKTTGQVTGQTTGKTGAETGKTVETGKTTETGKVAPTILDGSVEQLRQQTEGDEGGDKKSAAAWPDDWREQAAGGNAEVLKLVKRYGSVTAVATALHALRTRLDTGEFKKGLGKDATEDEVAQYRKDNGIPEKPEGYELPKGLKISETDKPIVDQMIAHWHGQNRTPEQVASDVDTFFKARAAEEQQKYDNDIAYMDEQLDTLQSEYGRDFPGFRNTLKKFVPQFFGKELGEAVMGARLKDGTIAGNNGLFLKKLVEFAKRYAPEMTLTDAGAGGSSKAVADRIAEIEKVQRTDRDKYFADERMQAEYKELIGAQLRQKELDKAA